MPPKIPALIEVAHEHQPILALVDGQLRLTTHYTPMPFTLITQLADECTSHFELYAELIAEAIKTNPVGFNAEGAAGVMTALVDEFGFDEKAMELAFTASQILYPLHVELYGYASQSPADEHLVCDDGQYPEIWLKARTLKELSIGLFGVYRKDLAKAILASDEASLLHAWLYSPNLEPDWIVNYLRETQDDDDRKPGEYLLQASAHRHLASHVTPRDARRLLRDSDPLVGDMVSMWASASDAGRERILDEGKIKGVRDLHDRLLSLEQKAAFNEYLVPDVAEERVGALNHDLKSFALRIVRNSTEAADVGAALKNCCGAQFNREAGESGSLVFVAVFDRDKETSKPVALLSMRSRREKWVLSELKRNRNEPDEELEKRISNLLESYHRSSAQK